MFLVSLDLSIVNVALPAMDAALDLGPTGLAWVINAFLLPYAGLLLLGGRLADLVGRRTLLLGSLGLFALASLSGGAAQEGWQLIAGRGLQGVAAAVLTPISLALVTAEFEEGSARNKAMAIWGGAGAAGGALGVVLSGLLTDHLNWRWVMWVNVVFVAAAMVAVLRGVDNRVPAGHRRPDILGGLLVTAGVTALVLGVIGTDEYGWGAPRVLAWFVAGAVALLAFAAVEARVADPLVPLGFLRRRSLIGAAVFGFLLTSAQIASFFFVSQIMQRVLGYSPTETGLAFLPFCVGIMVGLRAAQLFARDRGPRPVLLAGGLVGAAGLLWFGFTDPSSGFVTGILGPSLVCSVGVGAAMVAMGLAAASGVPAEQAGLASGILNSSRQLGGALGLAALVTVASSVTGDSMTPDALSDGFSTALRVAAALLALGAIAATLIVPGTRPEAPTPDTGDALPPHPSTAAADRMAE
ncbi:MFS transporter [Nocardia uniformis]|uniref:MFS transporter n=2 Tax=Nocardia uniformis TaxID=53432 RepID=A0A849BVQ8_9NOCA|nr:MFS transporter [Nocardia uniformis]